MKQPLKLTIDLVPKGCWGQNLWSMLPTPIWDSIRKECYHKAGGRCEVCSAEGVQLQCHEVWHYHSIDRVQKLIGLLCLCPKCHQVKHIGRSVRRAREGELKWADLVSHFCTVNNCDYEDLVGHYEGAIDLMEVRDRIPDWKLDLTYFKERLSLPPISTIKLGEKAFEE